LQPHIVIETFLHYKCIFPQGRRFLPCIPDKVFCAWSGCINKLNPQNLATVLEL